MNKQITAEFRNAVNKKQRELLQQQAPKLRTLEFAPKYDAMDATTKEVFEDIISPYSVYDKNGDVIGFNVNLDAAAAQAAKIAKRFNTRQPEQQEPQEEPEKKASSPALDMKSGPSQTTDKEPKTIGEALKMYDAAKRKEKNNG